VTARIVSASQDVKSIHRLLPWMEEVQKLLPLIPNVHPVVVLGVCNVEAGGVWNSWTPMREWGYMQISPSETLKYSLELPPAGMEALRPAKSRPFRPPATRAETPPPAHSFYVASQVYDHYLKFIPDGTWLFRSLLAYAAFSGGEGMMRNLLGRMGKAGVQLTAEGVANAILTTPGNLSTNSGRVPMRCRRVYGEGTQILSLLTGGSSA